MFLKLHTFEVAHAHGAKSFKYYPRSENGSPK